MTYLKPDFSTERLSGRWREEADAFLASPEGQMLVSRINALEANVVPATPFRALELTPFERVRVVILGQDPYATPEDATGLAFSVAPGRAVPKSLQNIFKEIAVEDGSVYPVRQDGALEDWAAQGVLLLNAVLTTTQGERNAHSGWGWEAFTDRLVSLISKERRNCVFLLWGAPAQAKSALINSRRHLVIKTSHPSPLSHSRTKSPFTNSGCFKRVNTWLLAHGEPTIDWAGEEARRAALFRGMN